MRNINKIIAVAGTICIVVTGCSNAKVSSEAYLSGFNVSDYIELPDYSNIEVDVEEPVISDEDVAEEIDSQLEYELVEVTDRETVQVGDVVNIDYVGTIDGEEIDGGSYEGYDLEIGSGTFIDGFEDGLVDCYVDETVDLIITFPDDYSEDSLAGQEAIFSVTINSISEYIYEEFTDEWVKNLSLTGISTTDDYEDYIYSILYSDACEEYEEELQEAAIDYLVANCTVLKSIPDAYVQRIYDEMYSYYEYYAEYYSMDYDDFMVAYFGADEDDPFGLLEDAAYESAFRTVVMQAVADAEGLNLSEEEKNEWIEEYASYYGYDSAEEFEESEDIESFLEYVMTIQVYEFLLTIVE